jgi:hypothetical protein
MSRVQRILRSDEAEMVSWPLGVVLMVLVAGRVKVNPSPRVGQEGIGQVLKHEKTRVGRVKRYKNYLKTIIEELVSERRK